MQRLLPNRFGPLSTDERAKGVELVEFEIELCRCLCCNVFGIVADGLIVSAKLEIVLLTRSYGHLLTYNRAHSVRSQPADGR